MFNFNNFNNFQLNEIINLKDLNYMNGKKYTNIFELRKLKNFYLTNIIQTKVRNFILINYEDLLYNYDYTLNVIKEKFNLVQKSCGFIKITNYKKSQTYTYKQQRAITFINELIKIIWAHLDIEQESKLGYHIGDIDNFYFKNKSHLDKEDNIPESVGR